MKKGLLATSMFFLLTSCSDGFSELEDKIKLQATKNNIEMSYFQLSIYINGAGMILSKMRLMILKS